MRRLTRLDGIEFDVECLGCELRNNPDIAYGGIIYETENFFVVQDFELPIEGFFIVSLKEHKRFFTDLTPPQRVELFDLVAKVEGILRELKVCETVNLVCLEKWPHFHFWIMPVHNWMIEKFKKTIANFGQITAYAKENMRNDDNFNKIKKTITKTKELLNRQV